MTAGRTSRRVLRLSRDRITPPDKWPNGGAAKKSSPHEQFAFRLAHGQNFRKMGNIRLAAPLSALKRRKRRKIYTYNVLLHPSRGRSGIGGEREEVRGSCRPNNLANFPRGRAGGPRVSRAWDIRHGRRLQNVAVDITDVRLPILEQQCDQFFSPRLRKPMQYRVRRKTTNVMSN